ncbi:MAG: hypothetical protein WBW78_03345 [Terrimicrobiaceae bacterium]
MVGVLIDQEYIARFKYIPDLANFVHCDVLDGRFAWLDTDVGVEEDKARLTHSAEKGDDCTDILFATLMLERLGEYVDRPAVVEQLIYALKVGKMGPYPIWNRQCAIRFSEGWVRLI